MKTLKGITMTFTRLQKGKYSFKGIDSWNGKEIEGIIFYQPIDKVLSRAWEVIFNENTEDEHRAFCGKSLKECKQWLTN